MWEKNLQKEVRFDLKMEINAEHEASSDEEISMFELRCQNLSLLQIF